MFKFMQQKEDSKYFIDSQNNFFSVRRLVKFFCLTCITFLSLALVLFLIYIHPRRPIGNILLYHSISIQGKSIGYPAIDEKLFKRQMDYLVKYGYEPVFLSTIVNKYKKDRKIPSKWIAINFDDGNRDFYDNFFPLLKTYKFKSTLFIITSRLDTEGYFSWEQLKEIKKGGLVEIGSHSLFHKPLTCLSLPEAKKEINLSKKILEDKLGVRVYLFSYPYGAFNYSIVKLVREAGYHGAAGTTYPIGKFKINGVYNMSRIYVSEFSRIPFVFRFMLSGYYVPTRALVLRILNIEVPRAANDCN